MERVTFSPGEFATLFGRSQTWGYRQIYSGKVKAITEYGRILIPAAEVQRILASAERYEGQKAKPPKTKVDFQSLEPKLKIAWRVFLQNRRSSGGRTLKRLTKETNAAPNWPASGTARADALKRLGRKS